MPSSTVLRTFVRKHGRSEWPSSARDRHEHCVRVEASSNNARVRSVNHVMLKTILVGLNWSASSRAAGELAIAWAKQHHAQILGVGVVESERQRPEEDLAEAHRRVEALLTEFEWSGLSAGLAVSVVKEHGEVETVLLRHSQRADLLVVGLNRATSVPMMSPLSRTLDMVMTNAIHPVVCVPQTDSRGHSVLVAYDGSLQAARTLFAFVGLGLFPNELIRLVSIDDVPGQHTEALALANQYLAAHGYRTQTEQLPVQTGGVSETLLRHVAAVQPKLVVSGVFGKSWTRSVLCGSVTKRLLHESCAPLFLYH